MSAINDLDACQRVAMMRRGGVPDSMIAAELGVSLDALRRACPENPDDPLGLQPRKPHGPRGHAGDPFANVAPYVSPFAAAPPAEGGGLAVLFVLLILAG